MLFSRKENIFKYLVAFQKMFWKIFSGVWLCSWNYHRKHIFYLLLTFSQLPNKYIISFLNTETQTKPKKKIHQIRSNWEKKEEREVTGFDERRDRAAEAKARSRGAVLQSRSARCCDDQTRFKREREIKKERDRRRELRTRQHDLAAASGVGSLLTLPTLSSFSLSLCHSTASMSHSFSLSLFLPLSVCELLSLRVSVLEVIWR